MLRIINSKHFGILVKNLRKTRKITQLELSKEVGVRQATISEIENGSGCSLELCLRIVNALGAQLLVNHKS